MAEPNARGGSATRKIKWLAVAIVIVIGLYAGLWMFLASRLDRGAAQAMAQAEAEGTRIECAGRDVRGFPFRLGLFCERTGIALPDGTTASAGELRSAAQIYDPGLVISELDGPASVAAPGLTAEAAWDVLRASTNFGIERLNLGVARLENVRLDGTLDGAPMGATLDRLVASVRPNGPDLDAAITVDALDAAPIDGRDAPPIDLRVDATVSGAAGALAYDGVPVESLRGRTLTLRSFDLAFAGGGRLAADGSVSVDGDGLASGSVEIGFSDLPAMVDAVVAFAPDAAAPLRTVATVIDGGGGGGFLSGLVAGASGGTGAEDAAPDDGLARVTIRLQSGEARLGVIPLGSVPPLP